MQNGAILNSFNATRTYCILKIEGKDILGTINQNPRTVLSSIGCEFEICTDRGQHIMKASKVHILPISNNHKFDMTFVTHNEKQYFISGKPEDVKEKIASLSKNEKITIHNFGAGGHRIVPVHEIKVHE